MKICKYCNKIIKDYPKKKYKDICSSCDTTRRRWLSKISLMEKMGNKCQHCGYTGNPGAFHFHHRDAKDKKYELNSENIMRRDKWDEASKCDLLCANCHQIQHVNLTLIEKMGIL